MSHAYHEALPGYDERQILHDGCPECEDRGRDVIYAIVNMDKDRFNRATARALNLRSADGAARDRMCISNAERYVLDVMGLILDRAYNDSPRSII